jgi:hypothetical protein
MSEDHGTTQSDDVISKYKKLLSLARSNLESNQAQLSEKDKQINSLKQTIEELESNNSVLKGMLRLIVRTNLISKEAQGRIEAEMQTKIDQITEEFRR